MPCLFGCVALLFPRFLFVIMFFFGGDFLTRVLTPWYFLLLGFLFMPLTSLSFAYAMNTLEPYGEVPAMGWILIAVSGLIDLGLIGNGGKNAHSEWKERSPADR